MKLHHINLTTMDPSVIWDFYVNKLGFEDDASHWTPESGDFDDNRFFKAGEIEFHLSKTDPGLSERFGRSINPLLNGHIAFLVDDLDEVRERLREKDVPFADYKAELGGHWEQLFVADPSGQIIEFRERTAE
jgi:catechol 2,3-dioxygenase-like lactoylglutathione lyase family enzyme